MNDLLKKDRQFLWTDACQQAFDTLKQKFPEEPVLTMPDHTKPFQIETDASKYATGAVLTQLDGNGDRHPISFISKMFSLLNKTTTSTTENSLQSSVHWMNGITTSRDHLTLRLSCATTRTSPTTGRQRNSHDDKPDGPCIYQNLTSNWYIPPEQK